MRIALAAFLLATPALADVREAVEGQVLPGLDAFAVAADGLAETARRDCTPQALRAPWNEAFDAWMGVSHLRFGPLEEDGRAQAIEFWPDERDATSRALRALAAQDAGALEPEAMAEASVAARGLMALERLLYGEPYGADDPACGLARAIAADLAATAEALEAGWRDAHAEAMLSAGEPGNAAYMSEAEARATLYGALVTGLEFTEAQRLGRPMGTLDRPRPTRAEAWRSARSARNVALSLAALRGLAADLADAPETLAALDRAVASAEALDDPALAGVAEPSGRFRIEALRTEIAQARRAAEAEIGAVLGVAPGFNAADGD